MCNLDRVFQTARNALLRKAVDPSQDALLRTECFQEILNIDRKRGDHAEMCADCKESMKINRFAVEREAQEALRRMDGMA